MKWGWDLGEKRAREKLPGMGTAKRLLKIGISNVQLKVIFHL